TMRQKLMGFVMMIVLIVAVGVTVGANVLAGLLPGAWLLSFVIGATAMVALLVLLYRLVPNLTYALRQVLPGALLAGVLIEVLSLAFPPYQRIAGGFHTYGRHFAPSFLLAAANRISATDPRMAPVASTAASCRPSLRSINVSDAGRIAGKPSRTPPIRSPATAPTTPEARAMPAPNAKRRAKSRTFIAGKTSTPRLRRPPRRATR